MKLVVRLTDEELKDAIAEYVNKRIENKSLVQPIYFKGDVYVSVSEKTGTYYATLSKEHP